MFDRLKNYLPRFMAKYAESSYAGGVLYYILTALASATYGLTELWSAVTALKDADYTGYGAILEARQWGVLLNGTENDAAIQTLLQARYSANQKRGSEAQVTDDVVTVSGDFSATVDFLAPTETGWWVEYTYPDISAQCFVEAGKHIEITATNKGPYTRAEMEATIRRYIVPLDCEVLFL